MKRGVLALVGMGVLAGSFAWAEVNPHYGKMSLRPQRVQVRCNNIDDDMLVVGTCDNTSDGTALHLEEDCEMYAVGQTDRSQWEGENIIVMNHPAGHFVSAQMLDLDSEDGLPGLTLHFLVHVSSKTDGSFIATMDTVSLKCKG